MRHTLFISHATPEDNDFSIWIASRLEMLGYTVWLDKNSLLGGEKHWGEIDNIIRNEAIKFLLVYSKNICYHNEPGRIKDGINNEIELAKSIANKEGLKDYIIPLKLDDSDYDLFVGVNIFNHIPFVENWVDGLKQLIKKLDKDGVSKINSPEVSKFAEWFENEYIAHNAIIEIKELYYSSWWSVEDIPNYFYLLRFSNKVQADTISKINEIPLGKISNTISTFEEKLNLTVSQDNEQILIEPKEVFKIKIADLLLGFDNIDFPTHRDAQNHFKKLLSEVLHRKLQKKGLFWYKLANKQKAYYYTLSCHQKSISFKFPFRIDKKKGIKKKMLHGKYFDLGRWHYALSFKPLLEPIVGFSLMSHIIFTKDGFRAWEDKSKQHSARRLKGKSFFNEEWRDMELAFINGLKDNRGSIEIEVGKDLCIRFKDYPEMYWADFGYFEPKVKIKDKIIEYEFEDE